MGVVYARAASMLNGDASCAHVCKIQHPQGCLYIGNIFNVASSSAVHNLCSYVPRVGQFGACSVYSYDTSENLYCTRIFSHIDVGT